MDSKITTAALEGYIQCRYRGFLRLSGQQGDRTEYEKLYASRRDGLQQNVFANLRARYPQDELASDIVFTAAALVTVQTERESSGVILARITLGELDAEETTELHI